MIPVYEFRKDQIKKELNRYGLGSFFSSFRLLYRDETKDENGYFCIEFRKEIHENQSLSKELEWAIFNTSEFGIEIRDKINELTEENKKLKEHKEKENEKLERYEFFYKRLYQLKHGKRIDEE